MKSTLYIFGILFFYAISSTAQQTVLSSLYFKNYYYLNPAEAGREKGTDINAGYRTQWMGFDGAPTVSYLTGQHQLNSSIGVGGYVAMQKMSFISQMSGEGTFAYRLKLSDDSKLSAGLSLGFKQSNIDLSNIKADDYSDNLLLGANTKGMLFNAKFGLAYSYKKDLTVGLSFPQLLENTLQIQNSDTGVYNFARHWNFYATYNLELDSKVDFIPVLMIRNAQNVEHQFDLLGNFRFNKKYTVGVGLRQGVGFLVNLGAQINDMIGFYYAYDFTSKSIVGSAGSHEVMLSFSFNKKDKDEEKVKEEEEAEPESKEESTKVE